MTGRQRDSHPLGCCDFGRNKTTMKAKQYSRKLCQECGVRPALFRYHGRVKRDRKHTLYFRESWKCRMTSSHSSPGARGGTKRAGDVGAFRSEERRVGEE